MARPDANPKTDGYRVHWAQYGRAWSAAARSRLAAGAFTDTLLDVVAAYMVAADSAFLVDGGIKGTVYPDAVARKARRLRAS